MPGHGKYSINVIYYSFNLTIIDYYYWLRHYATYLDQKKKKKGLTLVWKTEGIQLITSTMQVSYQEQSQRKDVKSTNQLMDEWRVLSAWWQSIAGDTPNSSSLSGLWVPRAQDADDNNTGPPLPGFPYVTSSHLCVQDVKVNQPPQFLQVRGKSGCHHPEFISTLHLEVSSLRKASC